MSKQLKSLTLFVVPFLLVIPQLSEAAVKRSQSARVNFVRVTACPSTGKNKLPCPGFVIDHIVPLCAGGADAPSNMQWQTVADAKKKDVTEKRQCAAARKAAKTK